MNVQQLVALGMEGQEFSYEFFWRVTGNLGCASQWYVSNTFTDGTTEYTSAEQYMMVKKAMLFEDHTLAVRMLYERDPREVKKMGRLVKDFDNAVWDEHKFDIVVAGNLLKFSQDEHMKEALLATGDSILVEASPYDHVWGIGLIARHHHAKIPTKWHGKNLLGFALMEVREKLKC